MFQLLYLKNKRLRGARLQLSYMSHSYVTTPFYQAEVVTVKTWVHGPSSGGQCGGFDTIKTSYQGLSMELESLMKEMTSKGMDYCQLF